MKKNFNNKKLIILISCIVILIVALLSFINKEDNNEEKISLNTITKTNETTIKENESFYVDIKGNVNNPGVYEIKNNQTIDDIIKKAGGLKKNAYTDNINLSKLVYDEMVIYIHTKKEIEKQKELNSCTCTPIYKYIECNKEDVITTTIPITTTSAKLTTSTISSTIPSSIEKNTTQKSTTTETTTTSTTTIINENKKVNINTCNIEELMTLNGLGESKAKNIIEYRTNNGPFQTIEELLKVNGIGKKTFENIELFIEV